MNGSEDGTGKHGRCREVAVVGRWPSVEVHLCYGRGLNWEFMVQQGESSDPCPHFLVTTSTFPCSLLITIILISVHLFPGIGY